MSVQPLGQRLLERIEARTASTVINSCGEGGGEGELVIKVGDSLQHVNVVRATNT